VGEVKRMVGREVAVTGNRLKLIYLGRVLEDWERMETLGVGAGYVIQACLRVEGQSQSEPKRHCHKSPVSPAIRLECAFQNLSTLDALLTLCAFQDYQMAKRRFKVGQWVDVQDAARQWLEGQVREVREGKVLVHYLGWPQSWDEWLSTSSLRIQFFRLKTCQSLFAPTHSPYPTMNIDAFTWTRNGLFDFSDLLLESFDLLARLQLLLDRYFPLDFPSPVLSSPEVLEISDEGSWTPRSDRDEEEDLGRLRQWMGVTLDRAGRLVTDLGLLADSPCSSLAPMPAPRELLRLYN